AMGDSGWSLTQQYAALVRFGLWDEMIALLAPDPRASGLMAGYLYGRGVALAARGRIDEARSALAALQQLDVAVAADTAAGFNTLRDVLSVVRPIVAARIAASEDRGADAIDRKSTRLNSSHVAISYAVFCLKKKKNHKY